MSEQLRVRIMALGILVVVFVAGGVVGVALDRSIAQAAPGSGDSVQPTAVEERSEEEADPAAG